MKQENITYHIVGGGIAGLSCAKLLKQKAPNCRVIVYEAAEHAGGRCYSYKDSNFNVYLDNATHVILKGNKRAAKLVAPSKWLKTCLFWNAEKDIVSDKLKDFRPEILKSMCNTQADKISPKIIKKIFWELFPWAQYQRHIYFSENNITQTIINPLLTFADKVYTGCRLIKLETQFGRVAQLDFSNRQVEIGANDKIILALDAKNSATFLDIEQFEYNSIINIFYHTSQPIHLPRLASFMGVAHGLCDWIFVSGNILGVTISDVKDGNQNMEDLARNIWKQLDILRGVNSAFVPPFKVLHHKRATLCQNDENNNKRPTKASTPYKNMFIAGDWTMKDYPCCIETAILSAERAVRCALKA